MYQSTETAIYVCNMQENQSFLPQSACRLNLFSPGSFIDVGTGGGGTMGTWPQDFAINKEVLFLFLENAPFSPEEKVPSKCRAPSK